MTAALTLDNVEDVASAGGLAPEWYELWRHAPNATPFQSPAWLLAWWRAFSPGELCIVCVRNGARLEGVVPLYVERTPHCERLLPLGISASDYVDVLIDRDTTEPVACALVRHVLESTRVSSWEFPDLAPDATALRLPCPAGYDLFEAAADSCPVLFLPPGAERDCPVPMRKLQDVRLARNRAARRGEVALCDGRQYPPAALLEEVFRLHAARWQRRGEPGVLADARVRRFHRDALPGLLGLGIVRLYGLHIDQRMVAAYYGFLHRARAYSYIAGFDPDYAFESPGTILLHHAISEAVREGAREFHFLRGREPYKYRWGAVDQWNRRRVFRRRMHHAAAS
jgi:CelD/BcsL family acetyltransferase involved in cellulose biosynthesis